MKVAFEVTSEVGRRAVLLLLGDPLVDKVGVIGTSTKAPRDPRVESLDDARGFDLVATDSTDPRQAAQTALVHELPLVTFTDMDPEPAFDRVVQLSGASLGSGIAPSLAWHEVAQTSEVLELSIAWTEPGRPLRRGEAVTFPDPVGPRWGVEVATHPINGIPSRHITVPVEGEWAAAMARVTGAADDGVVQRVVGVSDLAAHLEGIALAAGVLTAAAGQFQPGYATPQDAAEQYLAAALGIGMAVASFTSEVQRSPRN
ncbi:MAG: hypothetical protein OEM94_02420 [Acidimicrobiia bacterium]|nr:hypothetical protein [Acidimicrobiia bacterium]